jgi:hypothetical protein
MGRGTAWDLGWNILYILKRHLQGLFREKPSDVNMESAVELLSEYCYNKAIYNFKLKDFFEMNKILTNKYSSMNVFYTGKGNWDLHSECCHGENVNSIYVQD